MNPIQINDVLEVPTDQHINMIHRGDGNMLRVHTALSSDYTFSHVRVGEATCLFRKFYKFNLFHRHILQDFPDRRRRIFQLDKRQIRHHQDIRPFIKRGKKSAGAAFELRIKTTADDGCVSINSFPH